MDEQKIETKKSNKTLYIILGVIALVICGILVPICLIFFGVFSAFRSTVRTEDNSNLTLSIPCNGIDKNTNKSMLGFRKSNENKCITTDGEELITPESGNAEACSGYTKNNNFQLGYIKFTDGKCYNDNGEALSKDYQK